MSILRVLSWLLLCGVADVFGLSLLGTGEFRDGRVDDILGPWEVLYSDRKRSSLRVRHEGADALLCMAVEPHHFCQIRQRVPLREGQAYVLRFKHRRHCIRGAVRAAVLMGGDELVRVWSASERPAASKDFLPLPEFCTQDWQEFNRVFVSQASSGIVLIEGTTQGDFELKDVSMTALAEEGEHPDALRFHGWWSNEPERVRPMPNGIVIEGRRSQENIRIRHASLELEPGARYGFSYEVSCSGERRGADHGFHYELFLSWQGSKKMDGKGKLLLLEPGRTYTREIDFVVPVNHSYNQVNVNGCFPPGNDFLLTNLRFVRKREEPVPVKLTVSRPVGGRYLYASLPCASINGRLELVKASRANLMFRSSDGDMLWRKAFSTSGNFSIPSEELPEGTYELKTESVDGDGSPLPVCTISLEKLARRQHEVVVDEKGRILVNGRPFLMLAADHGTKGNIEASWDFWSRFVGINTVCLDPVSQPDRLLDLLNLAKDKGLFVKVITNAPKTLADQDIRAWKDYVHRTFPEEVRQHESLLMYSIADEPHCVGFPLETMAWAYNYLKTVDPWHPVSLNEAPVGQVSELKRYSEFCDITGADIYPVPEGNPHNAMSNKELSCVGDYVRKMQRVVDGNKPVVMTLQGFAWGDFTGKAPGVYPSFEQQRYMAYDALLSGARGLVFWGMAYAKQESYFRDALFPVIQEIRALEKLWLNTHEDGQADCFKGRLRTTVRHLGPYRVLVAVNDSPEAQQVSLRLASGGTGMLQVWGEHRHCAYVDGVLTDEFAGYGVHVYSSQPLQVRSAKGNPDLGYHMPMNRHLGRLMKNANWVSGYWGEPDAGKFFYASFELKQIPDHVCVSVTGDCPAVLYINGVPLNMAGNGSRDIAGLLRLGGNTASLEVKYTTDRGKVRVNCLPPLFQFEDR